MAVNRRFVGRAHASSRSVARAVIRACAILSIVWATAGCQDACERLVQRFCACDTTFAENQRGCTLARDADRRRAAEEKVRARGKSMEQLCRERLDAFECPDRAVPEFYPGGFSFYE